MTYTVQSNNATNTLKWNLSTQIPVTNDCSLQVISIHDDNVYLCNVIQSSPKCTFSFEKTHASVVKCQIDESKFGKKNTIKVITWKVSGCLVELLYMTVGKVFLWWSINGSHQEQLKSSVQKRPK